ncbi:hypothetical protein [Streptomyces sp. NPDC093093]|uniref:hypothetical protein n=1 Tax=Streptomyces sp. NPDC093093 TaxID=3366025 RepID=UPI0037FE6988
MTAGQLKKWLQTDESKKVGQSYGGERRPHLRQTHHRTPAHQEAPRRPTGAKLT